MLAGWLSDRLHRGGRAAIITIGLVLGGITLFAIGAVRAGDASRGVFLVGLAGFLLIGPYSYLAGAISLDFGGSRGAASACGIIDGVGYLAGIMAGDTLARVVGAWGWPTAFRALAVVAWAAAGVGIVFWIIQQSKVRAERRVIPS